MKPVAIIPENLPLQLRIVGEPREDEQGVWYDMSIEDVETGRKVENILAIEIPTITGDNDQMPEAKVTLVRPSFRMEVKAVRCDVVNQMGHPEK